MIVWTTLFVLNLSMFILKTWLSEQICLSKQIFMSKHLDLWIGITLNLDDKWRAVGCSLCKFRFSKRQSFKNKLNLIVTSFSLACFIYILDSSNSSSTTFWTDQFGSSSKVSFFVLCSKMQIIPIKNLNIKKVVLQFLPFSG